MLLRELHPQLDLSQLSTQLKLQKITLPARYGFESMGEPILKGAYKRSTIARASLSNCYEDRHNDEKGFEEFPPKSREQGRVRFPRERDKMVVYCFD